MGKRITQRIYECSLCAKIPEDGELLWNMNNETWCEECCDNADNVPDPSLIKPTWEKK